MHRSLSFAPLLLALLLGSSPAWAVTISFMPTTGSVELGQLSDIELWVDGLGNGTAPSLGAWSLDVAIGSEVAFDSVVFGTLLGDESLAIPESFSAVSPGVGSVGLIQVSFLAPAALDALQGDSFLLATLSFAALGEGTAVFEIQNALLSDAEFPPGDLVTEIGGPVFVTVTDPIPEPNAALLFACAWGIVGIGMRKRTRGDR